MATATVLAINFIHASAAVTLCTDKLHHSFTACPDRLADNAVSARTVGRRVRRSNDSMFLSTITSTAANHWRRWQAAMQTAWSNKGCRTSDACCQKVWLEVSFQRRWQWQLINAVYCGPRSDRPTAQLLQR